jgi:CHAT domain-containing protein
LAQHPIKTLVFVLDGNFRSIPMAVLYDGNQYLVEKYSLALTPGLQLINPRPLQQVELRTLAAGVSEFRPPKFAALPNVPIELNTIASQVPSQVLLNQQFTTQLPTSTSCRLKL